MAVKFIPPKGLNKETVVFIKSAIKKLNEAKAIEDIDLGAIRMLATSYDMYLRASEILADKGPIISDYRGDPKPNPAASIVSKSYNQVMKIMTEFGLTVKSRSNIREMAAEEEESPLVAFIKNKK